MPEVELIGDNFVSSGNDDSTRACRRPRRLKRTSNKTPVNIRSTVPPITPPIMAPVRVFLWYGYEFGAKSIMSDLLRAWSGLWK